jgi:hypothetical protein
MKLPVKHISLPRTLKELFLPVIIFLMLPVSLCGQTVKIPGTGFSDNALNIEEIHLVTDRDIYIAGEQVYFSVSQTGRLTHTPGTLSKVVYVDLLDSYKTPVIQVKTGTDGFTGSGVFRIPDTLRTGNYFIRSFTNLMKNYPQALFAYRMITVVNPFRSLTAIKVPPSDHLADSVVFFPETGSLVAGLKSRLGLKCFNAAGDPVVISGTVLTAAGDTVAAFTTDRHGTALFELTPPDAGKLSMAVTDRNGAGRRFDLPKVMDAGLTFHIGPGSTQGEVSLRLAVNDRLRGTPVKVVYSPVCFAPVVKEVFSAGNPVVTFEPGSVPAGLARVTVTDTDGQELASRWYYHASLPPAKLDVSISSALLSSREKGSVALKISDGSGNPLAGVISVSVVKTALVNESSYDELAGNVQLPSVQSFRTEIEEPDINDFLVFCDENGDLRGSSGLKGEIVYLPESEGHLITGVVRDIETDEPLAGEELTLSVVGRTARCSFTRSDSDGRFSFPVMEYGRKEIVIQRLNPGEGGYYIDLNDPFLFEMRLSRFPGPYYPDTTRLRELNDAIISMQVSSIYDPFLKKGRVSLSGETLRGFFGEPDRTVQLSDFIQLTTLREVFKEIVPGLTTSGRDENLTLNLANRYPGVVFNAPPLVILDGIPVYDLEKVLDIPSSQIEKVEVLSARYFTGDIILNGIINIISHKGDLSVLDFDRSILRQEYDMLLDSYDVAAPDYSTDSLKISRIPDYRNTLYWNPAVRTGADGSASVEFWTPDEEGEYCIIADCLAADGRRARKVTPFKVAKN